MTTPPSMPNPQVLATSAQRKALLESVRTIAVVGASNTAGKAGNYVFTYLAGPNTVYEVFPVNPTETEIEGITCYDSLAALPVVPDLVNVFRRPGDCPPVALDAVAVGAKAIWLQLGIVSDEAAAIALDGGLDVVMDQCSMVEHRNLIGPPPP